ncbi:MAG: Pyridoxamine 5'-phosphate oxidase [Rhodanobacteraceae bacterium]|jgi:pyridoxamine 5'-phosphate oxidase|nr:MAG: Pyridoxamine 5'-phosphate oxidase [Rhodanobacteraceae bacterium]
MLNPTILETLRRLHAAACASGDPEPDAMTVATADHDGRVHARMVLLKTIDERGLTFFTRYDSDKGTQLAANPRVALCLHWKRLDPAAQVRIEGRAETLPAAESDAYFATRERLSQIGAWASLQSRTLPERAALERRVGEFEHEFEGREVPRPAEWGGYRVVPDMVEFWYAGVHRWNERERWELLGGAWHNRLLYP